MSETLWPNGTTTQPHVSSAFGPRKAPVGGASTIHRGVDFTGYGLVRSIAPGRVVAVGTPSGWAGGGTQVWVQHDGAFSKSMHMKAGSPPVRVGDDIPAGRILGVMGMTGTASGVHHHLEVTLGKVHYSNTGQIDPVPFIQNRISPAGGGGGIEIIVDKETFIAWLWEYDKFRSRDGGPAATWEKGPTIFERINGAIDSLAKLTKLVNPMDESTDATTGSGGWFPFRNAMSRWLTYHSRVDGPEGKGATIHERLNQIEAAVREAPGSSVTVKLDAAMLTAALTDPKVIAAFAGPIAKAVNDDHYRRLEK